MDHSRLRINVIEVINSLEKACEEYSKRISATKDLQQAKVLMFSMLDRIQYEVTRLKAIITMD
jgi:hypothetical protein